MWTGIGFHQQQGHELNLSINMSTRLCQTPITISSQCPTNFGDWLDIFLWNETRDYNLEVTTDSFSNIPRSSEKTDPAGRTHVRDIKHGALAFVESYAYILSTGSDDAGKLVVIYTKIDYFICTRCDDDLYTGSCDPEEPLD
ncbi:hypothetical protein DD237_006855 [Peronospora effusa]|uniref:Uncharacterized protein n=1 Tax=Peronospora effusa TaxID=542832 RepID=A0A425BY95_9STRA|nr:hypothetical protein DD237_006855 [Peronospora effusa]